MKTSSVGLNLGVGLLLGLGVFVSQVFAASVLTDSASQQKYERKVQLQLADMGLKARNATLPVFFCVEGKSAEKKLATALLGALSGNCVPVGAWDFNISQRLEDQAGDELLKRLSGKRFDILKIKPGKLSLTTLFESIETESNIKDFRFGTGSFSEFKSAVDGYLGENVAPLMTSLLSKAKDARYQEMKDKERETFLATVAKENSVPANFIEKLMNSAFVFASYVDTPTGSVTISQKQKAFGIHFSTNVSVNLRSRLAVYRFNPDSGKFDFYKEISEKSGNVSASDRIYPFRPTNAAAIIASFDDSYIVAAKASGIAVNVTLKEDDNFAIFSTIDEINAPQFDTAIGENEDVRVDSPFIVYQYIDGKKTRMGWAKARKVASQKTFKENAVDYKSTFDLVKGEMEIKDQLREHPWSGVLGFIDFGTTTLNVDSVDDVKLTGGGAFSAIRFGAKSDLGYMFNSPAFSEVWLELVFGYGSGREDITVVGGTAGWTDVSVVTGGIDLSFRHHLKSTGVYLGYKFGLGAAQISGTDISSSANDIVIRSGLGLNWGAQAGYLLTPNTEVFVNVQGIVPLGGAEAEIDSVTYNTELSGGVDVNIGFAMHIKSIGGLARLMK